MVPCTVLLSVQVIGEESSRLQIEVMATRHTSHVTRHTSHVRSFVHMGHVIFRSLRPGFDSRQNKTPGYYRPANAGQPFNPSNPNQNPAINTLLFAADHDAWGSSCSRCFVRPYLHPCPCKAIVEIICSVEGIT